MSSIKNDNPLSSRLNNFMQTTWICCVTLYKEIHKKVMFISVKILRFCCENQR